MVTTANRSRLQILAAAAVWMTLGADAPPVAAGDYEFTRVVSSAGPVVWLSGSRATINDRGQVAFVGKSVATDSAGIYRSDGDSLITIAATSEFMSVGGPPVLNSRGQVAFEGEFLPTANVRLRGWFVGDGGTVGMVLPITPTGFDGQDGIYAVLDDSGALVFTASRIVSTPAGPQRQHGLYRITAYGPEPLLVTQPPHGFAYPVVAEGAIAVYEYVSLAAASSIRLLQPGESPSTPATTDSASTLRVRQPLHVSTSGAVIFEGLSAAVGKAVYSAESGEVALIAALQQFPGLREDQVSQAPAANECGQFVVSGPTDDAGHATFLGSRYVAERIFGDGDAAFGSTLEFAEAHDINQLGQILFAYELRNGEVHERGLAIATPVGGMGGDFNHDGAVDRCDVSRLMTQFGTTANARWIDGDFNHDGQVTLADLILQQAHLTSPAAPSAAVPEPSGVVLASLLIVSGVLVGRRRG